MNKNNSFVRRFGLVLLFAVAALTACSTSGPVPIPEAEKQPEARFRIKPDPVIVELGADRYLSVWDQELDKRVIHPNRVTGAASQGPLTFFHRSGSPSVRASYFAEPQVTELVLQAHVGLHIETFITPVELIPRPNTLDVSLHGINCLGGDYYVNFTVLRQGDVSNPVQVDLTEVPGLEMPLSLEIPAGFRTYLEEIPVSQTDDFVDGSVVSYVATDGAQQVNETVSLSDGSAHTCRGANPGALSEFTIAGEGQLYVRGGEAEGMEYWLGATVLHELPYRSIRYLAEPLGYSAGEFEVRNSVYELSQEGHNCGITGDSVNDLGQPYKVLVCRPE